MVDVGLSFAKYVVFTFNFLFSLIGIAMAGIGIIIKTEILSYEAFMVDVSPSFPIVLIVVGCALFLIASLGCCGAIIENKYMLLSFAIALMTIVVVEVGIGVYAYEKKGVLDELLENSLNETLKRSKDDVAYQRQWDVLQTEFECCGINSPYDWKIIGNPIYLPSSCCHKDINNQSTCIESDAFEIGCKQALIDFINRKIEYVVAILVGISVFQVLGIIFSCCLFSVFRKKINED
ncbi:23 kDa integral membrane protein-like [Contarinia nasturtii]|uniref:23 kDa integral membrane protein-like n=1 Tax=Contarinia nasturtii TaxID=265458 RepID=UPI0012D3D3CD|nr:23 kDa integral membrane protein-like [Contarinia nasturtii]